MMQGWRWHFPSLLWYDAVWASGRRMKKPVEWMGRCEAPGVSVGVGFHGRDGARPLRDGPLSPFCRCPPSQAVRAAADTLHDQPQDGVHFGVHCSCAIKGWHLGLKSGGWHRPGCSTRTPLQQAQACIRGMAGLENVFGLKRRGRGTMALAMAMREARCSTARQGRWRKLHCVATNEQFPRPYQSVEVAEVDFPIISIPIALAAIRASAERWRVFPSGPCPKTIYSCPSLRRNNRLLYPHHQPQH
jgi:hypothetical protein